MIDALVSLIGRLLNPSACRHSSITWPRERDGKCYVMCQHCYLEMEYATPLQLTPKQSLRLNRLVKKAKRDLASDLLAKETREKEALSKEAVVVTSIQRRKSSNG